MIIARYHQVNHSKTEEELAMEDLPLVLCGPIVRRTAPHRACVWVALRKPCAVELTVYDSARGAPGTARLSGRRDTVQLAEHLHVAAVTAVLAPGDPPLDWGESYLYDLSFGLGNTPRSPASGGTWQRLHDEGVLRHDVAGASPLQRLVYEGRELPGFRLPGSTVRTLRIVHGSCRKPHGKGHDALATLDELLGGGAPPQILFLTGDQIYADDVDPHPPEDKENPTFPRGLLDAIVDQGAELFGGEDRERASELAELAGLLEPGKRDELMKEHAAFTSGEASCHLVTLAEFYAMYLFQWSDVLWQRNGLAGRETLSQFHQALPRVRRALANVSTYMSFDDHDVTDDWNRTALWVDRVAASEIGNRVVRNALVAYALFQHWGNVPEAFEVGAPGGGLLAAVDGWGGTGGNQADAVLRHVQVPASGAALEPVPEAALRWHWSIETPGYRVVSLDTRTRRHYHSPDARPGLMSKAAIDEILDPAAPPVPATIVVSPAPVLGLGLIEFIQDKVAGLHRKHRGESELITGDDKFDAEAWGFDEEINDYLLERLAGFRRVLLLSGDVHYGFGGSLVAEDLDARIVNFVSSALHNEVFAETVSKLLSWIGDRHLEALTDEEPPPTGIPETVQATEKSTSSMMFREGLLHEGGDEPTEAAPADRGEVEFEAFGGSRRRADVVGSCNLGEITFPEGRVEHRLRWRGRRRRKETLHVATFDL